MMIREYLIMISFSRNQVMIRFSQNPEVFGRGVSHRRSFVGVSRVRSWSRLFVFVWKYRQKLINLIEIDF